MLTKSVNKVYLLSYNACETRTFQGLKTRFRDLYRRILAPATSLYPGFDLRSDQTCNRPYLTSGPAIYL